MCRKCEGVAGPTQDIVIGTSDPMRRVVRDGATCPGNAIGVGVTKPLCAKVRYGMDGWRDANANANASDDATLAGIEGMDLTFWRTVSRSEG